MNMIKMILYIRFSVTVCSFYYSTKFLGLRSSRRS